MMNELQRPQVWREQLSQRIIDPRKREQLAHALTVHAITLNRWAKGTSTPRPEKLQRLLEILSFKERDHLLRRLNEEMSDYLPLQEEIMTTKEITIPADFYARTLRQLRTTQKDVIFTTLCGPILHQATQQFDLHRKGVAIIVAKCMPPSRDKVRTLRVTIGSGTSPWDSELNRSFRLLGVESLAGNAIPDQGVITNADLSDDASRAGGYRDEWEASAAATPIMRAGEIAGVLLISSTQPDYFDESFKDLLIQYAGLIAAICEPHEFYPIQSIALSALPDFDRQRRLLAHFQEKVSRLMARKTSSQNPLTLTQAENLVWQDIETALLWNRTTSVIA
jgi:transcriptional regulator with XRE-family HTH domain